MIEITALRWVPPPAQGLVRDLRVRWALEEAGVPYDARLLTLKEIKGDEHRQSQPFGQVPTYKEDGVTMFESGAIMLHIAEKSPKLLPTDPKARGRARTWLFAALNSIEPSLAEVTSLDVFNAKEEWAKLKRPTAIQNATNRLSDLSKQLGSREYLDDKFTIGDLAMTTVLRIVRHTDLVAQHPNLDAFVKRCEARPAFKKALEDQMKPFRENAPPSA